MKHQVADRLRELRSERSYTVNEFADRFGAKLSTARDWLNGRVLPRAENLRTIAEHFGVSTDWILGLQDARKCSSLPKDDTSLADEVASAIADRVADVLQCRVEWIAVDGKRALTEMADEAARRCQADVERFHEIASADWASMERLDTLLRLLEGYIAQSLPNMLDCSHQDILELATLARREMQQHEVTARGWDWSGPVSVSPIPAPRRPLRSAHRRSGSTTNHLQGSMDKAGSITYTALRQLLHRISQVGSPAEQRHQLRVIARLRGAEAMLQRLTPDSVPYKKSDNGESESRRKTLPSKRGQRVRRG